MKDFIVLALVFTLLAVLFAPLLPEMTDREIYVSEETNFLVK